MTRKSSCVLFPSLSRKCQNGVEFCRPCRRIHAEKDSDKNRKYKRNGACSRAYDKRLALYVFDGDAYRNADNNSRNAADEGNGRGFHQKLPPYIGRACAERFSYADFLPPFGYRNNHNIHNADAAYEQRNCGYGAEHDAHGRHYLVYLIDHRLHRHNVYRICGAA